MLAELQDWSCYDVTDLDTDKIGKWENMTA